MRMDVHGRREMARLMSHQRKSYRQVAMAVGWQSHGMVGHLLSGRKDSVKLEKALALAKYLGTDVSTLFVTNVSTNGQRKAA